jgi:glycosyltransferase involved in cell wall biosynthesis
MLSVFLNLYFHIMISVCVPVFNVDVRPLAKQLYDQIKDKEVPAEVLFFDDFSEEEFRILNRQISEFDGITYAEMNFNRGRASIRNHLGKSASQPCLLFLDGDSLIPDSGFLKKYIQSIGETQVLCGGTVYDPAPPDKNKLLRWMYGSHREQLPTEKRASDNKFAITANNFLINRNLFLEVGFREAISNYGHEDTVFGYDLFLKGFTVRHINNPVIHTGLESSEEYLRKTRIALDNLLYIKDYLIHDSRFDLSSGLLRRLKKLELFGLRGIVAWFFSNFEPHLIRNLTGSQPSLLIFDIYRLGYLCRCRTKNRHT